MKRMHLATFNFLVITCFFLTAVNAQTTKKHTEKFTVNEEVDIHVNTSHTNVKFETWDRNEIEVTFTLDADEKVEELFKQWNFEATGNSNTVNIESKSGHNFDMENFQFDFDMEDFDFDMKDFDVKMDNFNIDLSDLNLDIDNMVTEIMEGLNLADMPLSPFGKDGDFDGDEYKKNPNAYLKKLNDKNGTQVSRKEADQWMADIKTWADNIEVQVEKNIDLGNLDKQIGEQTKEIQESVEKWEKEHGTQIKEMTDKIEKQLEGMDFDQFENFNKFDQERANTKRTIHIKLPKKAKLHLNIRYGEVTLAENLRNINADLNYASLSANTINGEDTDISAAYALVIVDHWQNGHLDLKYCNDITIKKATKINLNAQGTDIVIGTLLNTGLIHSAYGDLVIQKLGTNLKELNLVLDYGSALLPLPSNAVDLTYIGDRHSSFSFPEKCKVVSDTKEGIHRMVKAYNQKQNSGNVLSIRANHGDLTIK
ncbi:MAG: hypothetical protein ACI8P3_002921 [Saprospiraceae bacterium]|jgi:hypothetical protein